MIYKMGVFDSKSGKEIPSYYSEKENTLFIGTVYKLRLGK